MKNHIAPQVAVSLLLSASPLVLACGSGDAGETDDRLVPGSTSPTSVPDSIGEDSGGPTGSNGPAGPGANPPPTTIPPGVPADSGPDPEPNGGPQNAAGSANSGGGPGSTDGPGITPGDEPGTGDGSCTNVRPTGTDWDDATCEQWASETTECTQAWMVDNGYCDQSCGRCDSNDGSDDPGAGGASGEDDPDDEDPGGPGEPPKFVGNITTNNQVNSGGLNFSTYWNQITPENAGKWGSVQPNPSAGFNWSTLDAIYDYAESNGIIFKQHTFVWGNQQPSGTPTEQQVITWIQSFCERYPNTSLIDVVNEPPPHTTPAYVNNIGGGTDGNWQWITNSFVWAREHCPGAILILNDYNNIEWPEDNQRIIDIVNTVLANGGPIDAIGAQAHDLDHASVTPQAVLDLLNKVHNDTGLPVYVTEMDLSYSDDQQQLSAYQTYFPMFMDADFVRGITIWGWIYGTTWDLAPDSGLVRNGSARPAMSWLMNELGRPVP